MITWPVLSPSLNPAEILWGVLARGVYSSRKQFSNIACFKTAIEKEGTQNNESALQHLVSSMQKRYVEVLMCRGVKINYHDLSGCSLLTSEIHYCFIVSIVISHVETFFLLSDAGRQQACV